MNSFTYYLLNLTFIKFFTIYKNIIKSGSKNDHVHFYINRSFGGQVTQFVVKIFWGVKFEKLHFELRHIQDQNGELVRLRIHREDLYEFQEKIIQSKDYKAIYKNSWKNGRVSDYIEKGLLEGYINSKIDTYPKILYLINVVSMHSKKSGNNPCALILNKQPWKDQLVEYAKNLNVELKFSNMSWTSFDLKNIIINLIRKKPRLYVFVKGIFNYKFTSKTKKTDLFKIYLEGRGNLNFNNNGHVSDLFLLNHSELLPESIAYKYSRKIDKNLLDKHGIYSLNGFAKYYPKLKRENPIDIAKRSGNKTIDSNLNKYLSDKSYWYSLFARHNIKIHLTWYDNNADHMAIADAIKDVGGIAAMWQTSFYGFKNFECKTNTDVMFLFSKFDSDINISAGSKNKYNIITGLFSNDNVPLLQIEAQNIRNKLLSSGAQKIVCVMDENSADDLRWHTGHELQRENYSYILEKVLEIPWLGVVFKPKKSNTLRRRLGLVNNLLREAEKTGRCIVLDNSGKHVSTVPAILGGLVADVTIHGHLSAGTAALECALLRKPTLLVDREGAPFSKLYELPRGDVVFNNWSDTIDALMDYFKTNNQTTSFGNWSEIIKELDPFNDNYATYRMSSYLSFLLAGLKDGFRRDTIMENAAQKYADRWGVDKIYD